MRKILVSILMLVLILFPSSVMAEGYISTTTKTLTIEEGSTKTFTIVAYDAIGDVTIKSENTSVATVNQGFVETGPVGEKVTKKFTITVKGVGIGTTKIKLDVDGASFSGGGASLASNDQEIIINVIEKKVDTRSKNNKLRSLTVEGHKIVKVNENNYTLEVGNNVTSIKIIGEVEDAKAKIKGEGVHDLSVGENDITITVTAENGSKNNIHIKVIRKDGYYLEDLETLLNGETNNIDIILRKNEKVSKDKIESIKKAKKIVNFNNYNEQKELIYSLVIDGSLVKQAMDMETNITNIPSDESIYEKVNYAEGMYVNIKQEGNLPNGTKVRIKVIEKYNDGDTLNIYKYNDKKMELVKEGVKINKGYIEFNVLKGMDYFVSKSKLNMNISKSSVREGMNIYMIISIVELMIIIILLCVLMIKKKVNEGAIYSKKLDKLFMTEENIFPVGDIPVSASIATAKLFPTNNN